MVSMTRRRQLLVFLAALSAVFASPTAAFAQTPTRLIAEVGLNDAAVITLRTEAGATVRDVTAGTYLIEVRDHSTMHNFHLTGPGVDESTSVSFVGTTTWTVTLQDRQTYRYVCDPHATTMRGSFTTGGGPPTPPPPPPPPPPSTTTLFATVGPGPTISLRTRSGRRVSRVRRGRYRIVVRDRSAMHNFHLRGPGINKRTTVAFRGTRTWTVTLRRGLYRFVCDPHAARMRGSFRVT
jgi:plastocyanin